MKKILSIIVITIIAVCLFSCGSGHQEIPEVKYKYLNAKEDIYTDGDTLMINGKKYIKVYGITECKYNCPVIIEVE
jgi:thioredoxin-related protein